MDKPLISHVIPPAQTRMHTFGYLYGCYPVCSRGIMHLKKLLHLLPSIILGLFIGRVLSEFLPFEIINPALNAIIWTVVAVSLALWVLRKFPFSQTWPALLLLLYVLYPEQNPSTAVLTSLLTILVWLQLLWGEISIKARWETAIALLSAFTFFLLQLL